MRLVRPALVLALLFGLSAVPSSAAPAIDYVGGGVLRGDLGPAASDPRIAAADALDAHAGRLGVAADDFALTQVRRSIVGTHVRGHEIRGGIPVHGSSAAVHIVDGRVVQVEARDVDLPGGP